MHTNRPRKVGKELTAKHSSHQASPTPAPTAPPPPAPPSVELAAPAPPPPPPPPLDPPAEADTVAGSPPRNCLSVSPWINVQSLPIRITYFWGGVLERSPGVER